MATTQSTSGAAITTAKIELSAKDYPVALATVYTDRAELTHTIKGVYLSPGKTEVIISNFPRLLDTSSIRVETKGEIILQDIIHRHRYAEQPKPNSDEDTSINAEASRRAIITNQITSLDQQMERLRIDLNAVNDSLKFYDTWSSHISSIPISGEGVVNPLNGQAAFTLFREKYRKHLEECLEMKHSLGLKIKELEDEKSRQEHELGENVQVSTADVEETKEITVLVLAEKETELLLDISYIISGANWSPKYEIRVISLEDNLILEYQAEIKQYTGEDWKDINLTLSTAQPATGGDPPKLSPWNIKLKKKFLVKRKMKKNNFGSMRMASARMDSRYTDDDEEGSGVMVREGVSGMIFEIPSRTSIPSDNSPHKVNVARIVLTPQFKFYTCPVKAARTYLLAMVKNKSEYALLPGPANIFLDNSFVAKSALNHVSPEEEFELSLGVDPAVRINYLPRIILRQTQGFLSKSRCIKAEQVIVIRNTRPKPIVIQVLDRVPISSQEKIRIVMTEPTGVAGVVATGHAIANVIAPDRGSIRKGKGKEVGEKSGESADLNQAQMLITGINNPRIKENMVLEWLINVEAEKQATVKYAYDVIYPLDEEIEGL